MPFLPSRKPSASLMPSVSRAKPLRMSAPVRLCPEPLK